MINTEKLKVNKSRFIILVEFIVLYSLRLELLLIGIYFLWKFMFILDIKNTSGFFVLPFVVIGWTTLLYADKKTCEKLELKYKDI